MTIAYVAKTRGEFETVTVLAPVAGAVAGAFCKVQNVLGICLNTAASGHAVTMIVKGIIVVPKATGAALAAGKRIAYNGTAGSVSAGGAGDDYCGWVTEAAISDAAEVEVMLDGYLHEQVSAG